MSKIRTLTTASVFAYFASAVMPEEWIEKSHIGAVPIDCFILLFICCLLYLELFGTSHTLSLGLLGGVAGLLLMAGYGYSRGNVEAFSLKFFIADVYYFAAFLTGLAFGNGRDQKAQARIVIAIAWLAAGGIIFNYVGLFMGFVDTKLILPPDRQVTGSIYMASAILLIVLPWVSVALSNVSWQYSGIQLFVFFAVSAVTALISGTRTIFLLILLALVLCAILNPRRLVFLLGGFSLLAALLFMTAGLAALETALFERMASEGLSNEARSTEVFMLWEQISSDLVLGQGMGSRFISDVVIEGDPLASAPHVGILTFLLKGGVLAFIAYAIVPTIRALVVLSSSKNPCMQRGAAASLLVFVSLACLSGGWNPMELFLYGFAAATITGGVRHRERAADPGGALLLNPGPGAQIAPGF